ncbi:PKD domain-containing protein [Anaeromyxobacter oryzae]|uniref:PKD/Chitinase domain-containing protein n=1 Tax=Anaeromyxobacter oryzae TaxID=2918170 RepID=A0ABN6MMT3_9BACT|nr:PKD domain-containing protein [Anaeromyxobacter oryzae]BDG02359.1 hypothetical protein AMOR_13550 [Anaeromyxobacter oryzae]
MRTRGLTIISFAATLAVGCSSGAGSKSPTETSSCSTVVASAGGNQNVAKNTLVQVDALQSTATNSAPLQFAWQLSAKPAGSHAALVTATGPVTSFLADVEGTYVVKVLVTGTCTAQASAQIFAVNTAPAAFASAQPSGTVAIRSPVALDGTSSRDPDGDPIAYSWSLSRPAGSAAVLDDAAAPAPRFTPDVPGHYDARLVVSDASATSVPAHVAVDAVDLPPVARLASAALAANTGDVIALDATQSSDPDHDVVAFGWEILTKPDGSSAALADATSAVAHLTPDAEGVYTVQVTVADGAASATATATVTVYRRIELLAFTPVDAEYSRSLDRIVMVSASPNALHVHDAAGAADASVALPLAPTCVSVSPDGKFAVVGHSAFISYVDLEARTVIKTWPISADADDVILSDPMTVAGSRVTRFAYVYPLHDQWSNLHVVDLGTGTETLGTGSVYAGGRFKLQPGTNHVFLVELGLSPQQLYRHDINATTGAISYAAQSPYWGVYSMGSDFWISDDGAQILFSSGNRFRTSDMTYAGSLGIRVRAAFAPASPSAAAGDWIVQPAGDPYAYPPDNTSDQSFQIFDSTYFGQLEQLAYPKYARAGVAYPVHGQYVFFDAAGTKRLSVVKVDSSASLLNSFGVVVY